MLQYIKPLAQKSVPMRVVSSGVQVKQAASNSGKKMATDESGYPLFIKYAPNMGPPSKIQEKIAVAKQKEVATIIEEQDPVSPLTSYQAIADKQERASLQEAEPEQKDDATTIQENYIASLQTSYQALADKQQLTQASPEETEPEESKAEEIKLEEIKPEEIKPEELQVSNGVVAQEISTIDIQQSNGVPPPLEERVKAPLSELNRIQEEAVGGQESVPEVAKEKVEMTTIPLYNYQGNPRLQVHNLFNASVDKPYSTTGHPTKEHELPLFNVPVSEGLKEAVSNKYGKPSDASDLYVFIDKLFNQKTQTMKEAELAEFGDEIESLDAAQVAELAGIDKSGTQTVSVKK